jgi:hypothetical protein
MPTAITIKPARTVTTDSGGAITIRIEIETDKSRAFPMGVPA